MLAAAAPAVIKGASAVVGVVKSVGDIFKGGPSDVMARVWKNIQPSDAWRFNAKSMGDGWHDISTGAKLSQEESDKRVTTVIANYVGAIREQSGYWADKLDGHQLTSAEALARWNATYGEGATPATVLQFPPRFNASFKAPPAEPPPNVFVEYARDQIQQAADSARRAGENIVDAAKAGAEGAKQGAADAARREIVSQSLSDNKWVIAGVVVGIVGIIVALSSRKG